MAIPGLVSALDVDGTLRESLVKMLEPRIDVVFSEMWLDRKSPVVISIGQSHDDGQYLHVTLSFKVRPRR